MDFWLLSLLNGISYGLLLFMLSAGLTLIFSMMGVLNFAHASFYMLGAYLAYSSSAHLGFWSSFLLVPAATFILGALMERYCLRRTARDGHLPELLITFGFSMLLVELVQMGWGRAAVDYRVPEFLHAPFLTIGGLHFPRYRAMMMLVALLMLTGLWWVLRRTRLGLVVTAALTHADMVQALGHNIPRVKTLVFAAGSALAGLAGVLGGHAFVTEPGMAAAVGPIVFVVVVIGGLGSVQGAFWASMLVGCMQTFAVSLDFSVGQGLARLGWLAPAGQAIGAVLDVQLSDLAPMLPFLLLVMMLLYRPRGLLGRRDL